MNSLWSKLLAAAALLVLAVGTLFWLTSRGGAAMAGENVVYVCSETGQVLIAPLQPTPAINPETGNRTLLRGVYCRKCRRWFATPPPEHVAGNPKGLQCRYHKIPMTTDGPLPAADDSKL